ncbi:MAG: integrase, partial [Clostridia bacterium]|nr:integrase [Clostridia bacterium]
MIDLQDFAVTLAREEKSKLTIEKYLRDVKAFLFFCGGNVTKETVVRLKEYVGCRYEKSSANSMIAAVNSWLKYSGMADLCVRQFRIQKKPFSPKEKELSRDEYSRLVKTAERNGNERLSLVVQTICGTGIRVSELKYITV